MTGWLAITGVMVMVAVAVAFAACGAWQLRASRRPQPQRRWRNVDAFLSEGTILEVLPPDSAPQSGRHVWSEDTAEYEAARLINHDGI